MKKKELRLLLNEYDGKTQQLEPHSKGVFKRIFGLRTVGMRMLNECLNSMHDLEDDDEISGPNLVGLLLTLKSRVDRINETSRSYENQPEKSTNQIYNRIYDLLWRDCAVAEITLAKDPYNRDLRDDNNFRLATLFYRQAKRDLKKYEEKAEMLEYVQIPNGESILQAERIGQALIRGAAINCDDFDVAAEIECMPALLENSDRQVKKFEYEEEAITVIFDYASNSLHSTVAISERIKFRKDVKRGLDWWMHGSKNGDKNCSIRLARYYAGASESCKIAIPDGEKAMQYLELAKDQGSQSAKALWEKGGKLGEIIVPEHPVISIKKPLWLLDVDETLLTNYDGEFYYNETLISFLKKNHITNVTFLTKMDPAKVTSVMPLRVELIQDLAENGISVDAVLSPQELLFEYDEVSNNSEYRLGSFYEDHMKPLEEAVVKMKAVFSNSGEFQKCMQMIALRGFLNNISMLKQMGILTDETPLSEIQGLILDGQHIKSDLNKEIAKFYSSDSFNRRFQRADFGCLDKLVGYAVSQSKKLSTVLDLCLDLKEQCTKFDDSLSDDRQEVLSSFEAEYTAYRNRTYILSADLNLRVAQGRLHDVAIHPTKGHVLQCLIEKMGDSKPNLVVFVDDSKRELSDVREASKQLGIELITTLPPESNYFDTQLGLRTDKSTFEGNTAKAVLVQLLLKYANAREAESGVYNFFRNLMGTHGQLKVHSARKLASFLQGEDTAQFSSLEMHALLQRESKLGGMVEKYCKEHPNLLPVEMINSFNQNRAQYLRDKSRCAGPKVL